MAGVPAHEPLARVSTGDPDLLLALRPRPAMALDVLPVRGHGLHRLADDAAQAAEQARRIDVARRRLRPDSVAQDRWR